MMPLCCSACFNARRVPAAAKPPLQRRPVGVRRGRWADLRRRPGCLIHGACKRMRGHRRKGGRSPSVQAKGKRESVAVAAMGGIIRRPRRLAEGASSRSSRIHTIDWDGADGRPAVRARPTQRNLWPTGWRAVESKKGTPSFLCDFDTGGGLPLVVDS